MNIEAKSAREHAILHVLVVGFHHKRGSQIEYCFPPIAGSSKSPDLEQSFPEQWRDIASLAIPDGAHNVESDIIYFVLPSAEERNRTVYGISCYRQIAVDDDLRGKDEQVTRSTIQKSVCVLSTMPVYGILKAKLEVITQAYFNEKDFSKVEVLVQMYNNLCDLFNDDYLDSQMIYSGISLIPLLKIFKHRALVLFKLLLLEKRVMFNIFPVTTLGDVMIGLISLFPGLLEKGLTESASYSVLALPSTKAKLEENAADEAVEAIDVTDAEIDIPIEISVTDESHAAEKHIISNNKKFSRKTSNTDKHLQEAANGGGGGQIHASASASSFLAGDSGAAAADVAEARPEAISSSSKNPSSFDTDEFGFPLSIFTKGCVFHPYLSICSIDTLRSDNIRAFCIGVTNSMFTQRHELVDVVVSVDEKGDGQVNILSPELRRQLALTKQDLRFVDFLLKMIEFNIDPKLWEGSDDWLRAQFHGYLLAMLAASVESMVGVVATPTIRSSASTGSLQASAAATTTAAVPATSNTTPPAVPAGYCAQEFNVEFLNAWRTKHNHRVWSCGNHSKFVDISPKHPFAGQLSVNDVILRVNHAMNDSEQGRRVMSAFSNTGKLMAETGSRVRSSLASWWTRSNMSTPAAASATGTSPETGVDVRFDEIGGR